MGTARGRGDRDKAKSGLSLVYTTRRARTEERTKKDIHPEFHAESKVICNGEEVFTVAGTKKEYVVDVWSGNHPFYLNGQSGTMILDDERITKFNKKFEGLDDMFGDGTSKK